MMSFILLICILFTFGRTCTVHSLQSAAAAFLPAELQEELNCWKQERKTEEHGNEGSTSDVSDFQDDLGNADNEREVDVDEEAEVNKFIESGCGCSLGEDSKPCSSMFSSEAIRSHRDEMSELAREEKDLVVMAGARATMKRSDATAKGIKRQKVGQYFLIEQTKVCKTTFLMMHAIGLKAYKNIIAHYKEYGLKPRTHGNLRRLPDNTLSMEDNNYFKVFMTNYASNRSIKLPGHYPGYNDLNVQLLATSESKIKVWKFYEASCKEMGIRSMAYKTFIVRWQELTPYIIIMKPQTDLCWKCQDNNSKIMKTANTSEEEKLKILFEQEKHLFDADYARELYNEQCSESKKNIEEIRENWKLESYKKPCSYNGSMHYSFDFAQQLHYPVNPLQPGPAYFKTARKAGLFGVCCEALPRQVNYVIDESVATGKGANTVISYVHSFFEKHGLGEKDAFIHADNCAGQNKNNAFLRYFMWRIINGLHENISYQFLIAGHTKFLCDACFGLIKKRTHCTYISSLLDIVDCIESSTPNTGVNYTELVGYEDGTVLIPTYDWSAYFDKFFIEFQGITQMQMFSFSSVKPGVVYYRTTRDSAEECRNLLKNKKVLPRGFPPVVTPNGLSEKRKAYLFKEIRDFCKEEVKDIVCPNT